MKRADEAAVTIARGLELLEEIRDGQAQLIAQLAKLGRDRELVVPLTRADRAALAILLPAVNDSIGDARWTGAELLDYAKEDPPLLRALAEALGLDRGLLRRLGKLLSRVEAIVIDGYRVDRYDEKRAGAEWSISRV